MRIRTRWFEGFPAPLMGRSLHWVSFPRFRARIRQGSRPQAHISRKRRNAPSNPVAKEKSLKYRAKSTKNPAAGGLGRCHDATPGCPKCGVSRARAAIVSRSGDIIELKKTSTGSLGKVRNRGNGLWVYLIAGRTDTAHRSFGIRAGRNDSSAKIAWRPANGDPVPAVATYR